MLPAATAGGGWIPVTTKSNSVVLRARACEKARSWTLRVASVVRPSSGDGSVISRSRRRGCEETLKALAVPEVPPAQEVGGRALELERDYHF